MLIVTMHQSEPAWEGTPTDVFLSRDSARYWPSVQYRPAR